MHWAVVHKGRAYLWRPIWFVIDVCCGSATNFVIDQSDEVIQNVGIPLRRRRMQEVVSNTLESVETVGVERNPC